MEALAALLDLIKKQGLAKANLTGFFHVLIGRRVTGPGGEVLSTGLSWRDLANWLKKVRWDTRVVAELGLEVDDLPPKDRQRFWYAAIARAGVDSAAAAKAGDAFAQMLEELGYQVGPRPGSAAK
jgi:hypothetical protein